MTDFLPYLDILPKNQRLLWEELAPVAKYGFVLYGGTATALQLGHRESLDFDFFTENTFIPQTLASLFDITRHAELTQEEPNTLSVKTNQDVKISFFGGITIGRIGVPLVAKPVPVVVASLEDLMVTKLAALFGRIEVKDYQDIAAMIRHGVSLARGLAGGEALYGNAFQPCEALKALTWFHGKELETLDREDRETLVNAAREVRSPLPAVQRLSFVLGDDAVPDQDDIEDDTQSMQQWRR